MLLYCWNHNMTHQFAPGEVERIVSRADARPTVVEL